MPPGAGRALRGIADVFSEGVDHRFELVDAPGLLVDNVVERLDQVFLMGQLDLDGHETFILTHASLPEKPPLSAIDAAAAIEAYAR
jgi:hypothetical protein